MRSLRTLSGTSKPRPGDWLRPLALVVLLIALTGCAQIGQMREQPRYDPLEPSELFPDGRSARPFQPGAVPYSGDQSPNSVELTGLTESGEPASGFPVEVSQELILEGQERYNIYCVPCHGEAGEGDGRATALGFPQPPSLLSDQGRALTSGQIFNIITNGQGLMFPYGYRVKPDERWAVIAYIRALQLRNGAVDPLELTPEEINEIGQQP